MHYVADTDQLVADQVITVDQANVIKSRAREAMISIGINSLLCFGIISATLGLIFWLANALAVAVFGLLALAGGLLILAYAKDIYRMFGNAAALIGAGMLIGGAAFELVDNYEDIAGWVMLAGGLFVAAIAGRALAYGGLTAQFVAGSIMLMGLTLHLCGLALLLDQYSVAGVAKTFVFLYVTIVLVAAGLLSNVRLVTALAVVPFAQALDTGTEYFHALYAFYSAEPTLSILQMTLAIALCIWIIRTLGERISRHAMIFAILAFVVANLCALVGSLWGDVVGETIWGPGENRRDSGLDYQEFEAAREAFREDALVISASVYSILWAIALALAIFWAALGNRRGLFNTAVTFAAIHAYTQAFESLFAEPLAYVIGGLAAIPLAWGIWRLNSLISTRTQAQ